MKKIISFSIAILFLFQNSQICHEDFLRADSLLHDYSLHQAKYGDNIFVFFSKHYGNLKDSHLLEHEEDSQNHRHTPISGDCHTTHVQPVVVWHNAIPYLQVVYHKKEVNQNFFYQDFFSTFEKQSIFQPPQVA